MDPIAIKIPTTTTPAIITGKNAMIAAIITTTAAIMYAASVIRKVKIDGTAISARINTKKYKAIFI